MTSPLVWATLLSAFAVSLAQPNDLLLAGNPLLGLVAWVPLFWALRRTSSNRSAALLGALFGLVTTLVQNYWLAFFQDFALWTVGMPALGLAGYGALLGPILRTFLKKKSVWRPFAAGGVWAVFEFLKSNGFLGFPWGLAPYPFNQWPWFYQIIDITGLSFLSWLVISWNAWLSEALEPDNYFRKSTAVFFAAMTIGLAGYGFWRLTEPRPSRGTVELALVQQNGDPWNADGGPYSEAVMGSLRTSLNHSRAVLKTSQPDLIVWSETSLRWPLQEWRPYYERKPDEAPLFKTIRSNKAWWLFGNPYFQDFAPDPDPAKDVRSGLVNATVLMNPQAQIVDYYGKVQQVPFAEYIPFWDVPFVKSFFESVVGQSGTWDLGRQWTVFEVPVRGTAKSFRFSTPICFEDAFPWLTSTMVRNGAEMLVNLTNDSWSHRDSSQYQHLVASLYRSVENRVYLVRSTNSGVSCVISPTGEIVAGPLPSFQAAHMVVDLPLAQTQTLTPYTLYGDWLVAFLALWLVTELLITAWRRP